MPTIDRWLDEHSRQWTLPEPLRDAIRYSLLAPGKRVRPLLAWHACAASGGDPLLSRPVALAIELVHCFSLVHDDLPALDNDDLRRGRPTLHRHTSEAMAILAGDAMLTLAFDALATLAPEPLQAPLVRELTAATQAMIAGQIHDTLGGLPPDLPPRARLETIHASKTGALIRASCRMGALCAPGVTPAALEALTRYADAVGLMFQITDDLLDVQSTPQEAGKRTKKDADAGKLTYPGLLGVEASRAEVTRLMHECVQATKVLGPSGELLMALARSVADRRA